MIHLFGIAALVCYCTSAVLFFFAARRRRRFSRPGYIFLLAGFVLQVLTVAPLILDGIPLLLTTGAAYLFWLSLLLALSCVSLRTYVVRPTAGLILSSVLTILFAASSLFLHYRLPEEAGWSHSAVFLLHTVPAFLAGLCVVSAFVFSVLFMIQQKRLKTKSAELLADAPSLDRLDRLAGVAVFSAFILMASTIVSGFAWALRGRTPLWDDRLSLLSLAAWVGLGVLVFLRARQAHSARQLSLYTAWLGGLFFALMVLILSLAGNSLHNQFVGSQLPQSQGE